MSDFEKTRGEVAEQNAKRAKGVAELEAMLGQMRAEGEAADKKAATEFQGSIQYKPVDRWGETEFQVELGLGHQNYSLKLTKPEIRALYGALFEHRRDFMSG